jgi:hypothetical protein
MEFQMALRQPCGDTRLKPVRLRCTLALRDDIIGIALEGDGRVLPLHPGIERIMQEEIGQDRAALSPYKVANFFFGIVITLLGRSETPY